MLTLAKFEKNMFASMPFIVFFVDDLRYGGDSVNNHPTGLHPFNASEGDSINNEYYMGGDCE